jgi:hypothetical protein
MAREGFGRFLRRVVADAAGQLPMLGVAFQGDGRSPNVGPPLAGGRQDRRDLRIGGAPVADQAMVSVCSKWFTRSGPFA